MKRLAWLLLLAACAPADPPAKDPDVKPGLPTLVYYALEDGCVYCEVITKAFHELRPAWRDRINLDVRRAALKQAEMKTYGIRQGHGMVGLDAQGKVKLKVEGHNFEKPKVEACIKEMLR